MVRNLGDILMTCKRIYATSEHGKYLKELHGDVKSLIPKVSSLYRKMEAYAVNSAQNSADPHLALATKCVAVFGQFNDVNEWYVRATGDTTEPKKKKPKQAVTKCRPKARPKRAA